MAGIEQKRAALRWLRTTRRRSLSGAVAFSILTLVLAVPSVGAGVGWCRTDPVVAINGELGDIFVSARFDDLSKINGATEVVISTPAEVDARLAVGTTGFGYGEKVSFDESESLEVTREGIELRIKVRVPAGADAVPIRVEFAPDVVGVLAPAEAEGNANEWISLRAVL